jgi:ubiquinone/menaquinone biosynthesis C-methylase UbiE
MGSRGGSEHAVDLYGAQYGNFRAQVFAEVRREAFGDDFGQNGWQSADEQERFVAALALPPGARLLDVACGSGGPALRLAERAGCAVVGVDLHSQGLAEARFAAAQRGLEGRARFLRADVGAALPFGADAFDGAICVDAVNHLPDRARVLGELARVLRCGGRLVYTDPVVVTGWVTDEELRIRSSIGFFLFVVPGVNERLLEASGFEVLAVEDRTPNMAAAAQRWHDARARRAAELRRLEGESTFAGQQAFLEVTARLAAQGRLSRFAFSARKR